ncbi:MAG: phage holin family protein [Thermoleophilaceae bacterium]|nr:phage holin family protein [Thermoleophilaceae bacterium]
MTSRDGAPPATAEKTLAEIVNEVTAKATLLVHEEIELAKAEMQVKVGRLAKGAALGAAAGVFMVFVLIYLLHALSWFFYDVFNFNQVWLGYAITTGILLVLGVIVGLLALRLVRRGTPPTPELAIEEARRTRETLEEARH